MENTKPQTVYAGDEHPDRLTLEQTGFALTGLAAANAYPEFLNPKTLEQVQRAYKGVIVPKGLERLDAETTAKVIAALIVADYDLHGESNAAVQEMVMRGLRACGYRLCNGRTRQWLALDIWVVAIPDELSDYTLANGLLDKIESIHTIRFFDRSQVTHACSLSGGHYLEFLDMQVTLKPEFADDDDLRSEAYDAVTEANGAEINDAKLYDESYINRIIAKNAPGTVYHSGNPGLDLDEAMEGARNEMYQSIRSSRESHNYHLKQDGQPTLPMNTATINALVEEHFKADDNADELMHRLPNRVHCFAGAQDT